MNRRKQIIIERIRRRRKLVIRQKNRKIREQSKMIAMYEDMQSGYEFIIHNMQETIRSQEETISVLNRTLDFYENKLESQGEIRLDNDIPDVIATPSKYAAAVADSFADSLIDFDDMESIMS